MNHGGIIEWLIVQLEWALAGRDATGSFDRFGGEVFKQRRQTPYKDSPDVAYVGITVLVIVPPEQFAEGSQVAAGLIAGDVKFRYGSTPHTGWTDGARMGVESPATPPAHSP